MITPEDKSEIEKIVTSVIRGDFGKKLGDTPTDNLQLTNKKYVDDRTASGVYTPTYTNVANVDAYTAYQCQYLHVGDMVIVSGKVDIDVNSATATQLGMSLPIPSNFGAPEDCAGTFSITTATAGRVIADATNNRAEINFTATQTSNQSGDFIFMYQVI